MDPNKLLQEIRTTRTAGITYLVVYEKPTHSEWELSVLQFFPMAGALPDNFKDSLIKVDTSKLARDILTELLHHDLAYDAEITSLEKARSLADAFISLFSSQAVYFSNSTWNKNEYKGADMNFELGLSSWTSLTDETFDSGIIICDTDKIGIAWFADED